MIRNLYLLVFLGSLYLLHACASDPHGERSVSGNVGGSEPINDAEARDYKRAILKCYKTGGSRIVKVEGRLMCY